jgi:hypothetical protein
LQRKSPFRGFFFAWEKGMMEEKDKVKRQRAKVGLKNEFAVDTKTY